MSINWSVQQDAEESGVLPSPFPYLLGISLHPLSSTVTLGLPFLAQSRLPLPKWLQLVPSWQNTIQHRWVSGLSPSWWIGSRGVAPGTGSGTSHGWSWATMNSAAWFLLRMLGHWLFCGEGVCGLDHWTVILRNMRPWAKWLSLTQGSIQSLRAHI